MINKDIELIKTAEKPEGWPVNAIEDQLDSINNQVDKFIDDPSFKNKEVLVSLVTAYDLNQVALEGRVRTTDYEVACINTLFLKACCINLNSLKAFLYELVRLKTRIQKMNSWFPPLAQSPEIKEFDGLLPQLKLYYFSYLKYTLEKSKPYSEQLVEIVEGSLAKSEKDSAEEYKEYVYSLTRAYLQMLNDISYFRCVKRTGIWAFDRDGIYKLFNLAARLIKMCGDSPIERPIKGVLKMSISNYILKSRNDYNEDYVCKYISADVARQSIRNHQIWLAKTENLNDKREQKIVPELFEELGWNPYSWASNIDFTATRTYYVSSFCKSRDDPEMKRTYGGCVYGFKDDRLAELLAPVILSDSPEHHPYPKFSQVITFDVIYDKDEAREELVFLCRLIDCFEMSDADKKNFLEEILQYWILSVKDPGWAYERERRYVLFLYDEYRYCETDTNDDVYLKIKTSVFLEPDFILGDNPVRMRLTELVSEKKAIAMKPYMYCPDCLNRDYDLAVRNVYGEIKQCPICGSGNMRMEYPRGYFQ